MEHGTVPCMTVGELRPSTNEASTAQYSNATVARTDTEEIEPDKKLPTEDNGTTNTNEDTDSHTWVEVVSRRRKKNKECKAVVSSALSRNNPVS